VQGSTAFDANMNPNPIDFFRFSVTGVAPGAHQMTIRGRFAPPPNSDGSTHDSAPIPIIVDAPPAGRTTIALAAALGGRVDGNPVTGVGTGHSVHANGAVSIVDPLVTGLGTAEVKGIDGPASALLIDGAVFEATAAIDLAAPGNAVVRNSEWRAN